MFYLVFFFSIFFQKEGFGYLLLFGYSIFQISLSQCRNYLNRTYSRIYGDQNTFFSVLSSKKVISKRAGEIQKGDCLLLKEGEVCPFHGMVQKGTGTIFSFSQQKEKTVRKGVEIFPGSLLVRGELQIEVLEVLDALPFYQYGCRLREDKKISFSSFFSSSLWSSFFIPLLGLFLFLFLVVYQFGDHSLQYAMMIFLLSFFDFSELFPIILSLGIFLLAKKRVYVFNKEKFLTYSKVKNLVFTKTGVLTLGTFSITDVLVEEGISRDTLLETLYAGEYYAENRIGECVRKYCEEKVSVAVSQLKKFSSFENGVSVVYKGQKIEIGNFTFLLDHGITVEKAEEMGTILYIASSGKYLGYVVLSDHLLLSRKEDILHLKKLGISHIATFSRDNEKITRGVSYTLGISDSFSELTLKERDFWVQYLREMQGVPQAYLSDDVCPYDFDVRILYGNSTSLDADFVILPSDFSLIYDLTYLSKKVACLLRSCLGLGLLTKCFLFFLLLWIRDIFIIGGILLGVLFLMLGTILLYFYFIGRDDKKWKK